jgi:4-amino-4-deoxychorismate lyase
MTEWLINGVRAQSLSADDRGLAYGDGLFETIAVRDGKLRFADAHFSRLAEGCRRLAITYPGTAVLAAEAAQMIADREAATLKIIVTRGAGKRGYAADNAVPATRLLGVSSATLYPAAIYAEGIALRWCATLASENSSLAGLKSLNRLEQVLARSEWNDPLVHEGLMCDAQGHAVSGTMSNLFIVSHGELLTPSLERSGIRGTLRQRVMDLWRETGGSIKEIPLSKETVSQADEIFVTNALIGLWPVRELAGKRYAIGPVTRSLLAMLTTAGVTECAAGEVADA